MPEQLRKVCAHLKCKAPILRQNRMGGTNYAQEDFLGNLRVYATQ